MSDEQTDRARTVAVVVTDSPEGVQKYTASVVCDGEGTVEAVEAGALSNHFETHEGGPGEAGVTARAVDFTGEARHATEPTRLFTVTFDRPVPAAAIRLTVASMVDHAGERVPNDRVRFEVVE